MPTELWADARVAGTVTALVRQGVARQSAVFSYWTLAPGMSAILRRSANL